MNTLSEEEQLLLINTYYSRVWICIQENNWKRVENILHKEMCSELYDKSLSILFDKNIKPEMEELQHLIIKVNNKLEEYYHKEKDEDLSKDKFIRINKKSIF